MATAACDAATPGPWQAALYETGADAWCMGVWAGHAVVFGSYRREVDAWFVISARTDFPDALSEIERLSRENRHLDNELKAAQAVVSAARRITEAGYGGVDGLRETIDGIRIALAAYDQVTGE